MAKMIDKLPEYEGEKKVWEYLSKNLPQQYIVYNNRSIKGWEYDFCVMAENVGLFIIEVKGWLPRNIFNVVSEDAIILSGEEQPQSSPRKQVRGYRFNMINLLKQELGMNPLVMDLVCYPMISKNEYLEKRLDVVSDETETIFKEDLEEPALLFQKLMGRYNINKSTPHDILDTKRFALIRHHFEPNFDLKESEENLNPGYSRLRIEKNLLSEDKADEIVEEYFKGIKEIVFVDSRESMCSLANKVEEILFRKKLVPLKGNLVVGTRTFDDSNLKDFYSIFNFEVYVLNNIKSYVNDSILIEEGVFDDEQKILLKLLAEMTPFNFQQFEIEHAPSSSNIMVAAGAGTGKTYSMVSRVAYLCNRTADAVVDIVSDIAMITFTKDAAENMNRRLKRMFMNYFVLTSNEKYMHLIEDMSQIQIATIHKFAISLLRKECMRMGIGFDSQISSETFERRNIYHSKLDIYLSEKTEENPNFVHQLTIPSYELEIMLIEFCDQLYNRSIDIKSIDTSLLGNPIESIPYFNELIERVIIPSEIQYANDLKEKNMISLRDCMINIHKFVENNSIRSIGINYKYLFIDEFQDTDDIQIETILGLQKVFGNNCRLFVVGDLKQSIYRFRGATLSAFEKVGVNSDLWKEYSLNRNYRTDGRLLDIFDVIFTKMGAQGLLPYENEDHLKSRVIKEYTDELLVRKVETHGKDKEKFIEDLFNEIRFQKKEIEKLSKQKKLSKEEMTIAILVRYNYQISNLVKAAENTELVIKDTEGGNLFRLPSTRDLYKLVLAITHSYNKVYLVNFIESNYVSMKLQLSNFNGYNSEEKLDELVRILDEYFMLLLGKKWDEIISDFETRPVLVVLREIYEATKPWITYSSDKELQLEYKSNYECLLEKITQKYSREYLTVNMIGEHLKINITTYQEEASRSKEIETDEVNIICTTIHKSKGLEYGTVILPYTADDISSTYHSGLSVNYVSGKLIYSYGSGHGNMDYSDGYMIDNESMEQEQEESRILYVALTRAIRNVVWVKDLDSTVQQCWGNFMEVIE